MCKTLQCVQKYSLSSDANGDEQCYEIKFPRQDDANLAGDPPHNGHALPLTPAQSCHIQVSAVRGVHAPAAHFGHSGGVVRGLDGVGSCLRDTAGAILGGHIAGEAEVTVLPPGLPPGVLHQPIGAACLLCDAACISTMRRGDVKCVQHMVDIVVRCLEASQSAACCTEAVAHKL